MQRVLSGCEEGKHVTTCQEVVQGRMVADPSLPFENSSHVMFWDWQNQVIDNKSAVPGGRAQISTSDLEWMTFTACTKMWLSDKNNNTDLKGQPITTSCWPDQCQSR